MIELYRDAGLDARLVVVEEAGHGGRKFFSGEHMETVLEFLKRVLH